MKHLLPFQPHTSPTSKSSTILDTYQHIHLYSTPTSIQASGLTLSRPQLSANCFYTSIRWRAFLRDHFDVVFASLHSLRFSSIAQRARSCSQHQQRRLYPDRPLFFLRVLRPIGFLFAFFQAHAQFFSTFI